MNRDRSEIRKNRWKKIRQRIELMKNKIPRIFPYDESVLEVDGKYANNNYVNNGGRIKTNVRKAHSNYRRPGGFGEDKNWCPHDKRQLDDMDEQESEYKNEE